jgi:zinc protease
MQIDRTKRPLTNGEIKFNIPSVNIYELNNGLKIFFSEKNDLPIVRMTLLVNSGSRFDPEKYKGLSNLLTMCIDEGAGNLNALQLADEFEMLGAHFSVASDSDISLVSLQVLSENFIPALKLFKSVITEPHLNKNDYHREKRKVIVRLNQVKIEPDYVADISFEHFLFGEECPYSYPVLGIEKDIENILTQNIRDYYQQKFTPLNSSLIVVGNIDSQSLNKILQEEFAGWENISTLNQPKLNLQKLPRKVLIVNKPDSVQTEIRIGHLSSKRSETDFFQKQIINLVLGGQFSSRLNLNLREKHGYTYGIHSSFSYLKEAGYFAVSTSVGNDNTANALREIFSEIKKIKDGITVDEISFAKSSMTRRFPSMFETYRQISGNISNRIIHNLPYDYFDTYVQKVNSVSLEDVNKIVGYSINPEELITVLVGDSKKLLEQISEQEFGERIVIQFDEVFSK